MQVDDRTEGTSFEVVNVSDGVANEAEASRSSSSISPPSTAEPRRSFMIRLCGLPPEEEEAALEAEERATASKARLFQIAMRRVMESKRVQIIVLALIVCDLALVVADLILEESARSDDVETEGTVANTVHVILQWCSVAILILFAVEVVVLIASNGPLRFFRRPMYVLDFVVVFSSLGLELGLMHWPKFRDVVGLIVLARLWRVVRISHAVFVSTQETKQRRFEDEIARLKRENAELRRRIEELENGALHKDAPKE